MSRRLRDPRVCALREHIESAVRPPTNNLHLAASARVIDAQLVVPRMRCDAGRPTGTRPQDPGRLRDFAMTQHNAAPLTMDVIDPRTSVGRFFTQWSNATGGLNALLPWVKPFPRTQERTQITPIIAYLKGYLWGTCCIMLIASRTFAFRDEESDDEMGWRSWRFRTMPNSHLPVVTCRHGTQRCRFLAQAPPSLHKGMIADTHGQAMTGICRKISQGFVKPPANGLGALWRHSVSATDWPIPRNRSPRTTEGYRGRP